MAKPTATVSKDETFDNGTYFIDYKVDLKHRRIDITGDIDAESISRHINAIRLMLTENTEKPIDVYISSDGGCIYSGLRLYNVLRASPALTRTHGEGSVFSMAFVLYLAGDERYAAPDVSFMNHPMYGGAEGDPDQQQSDVNENKRIEKRCNEIIIERTGRAASYWKKDGCDRKNVYYPKARALKCGIVTHEEYEVI